MGIETAAAMADAIQSDLFIPFSLFDPLRTMEGSIIRKRTVSSRGCGRKCRYRIGLMRDLHLAAGAAARGLDHMIPVVLNCYCLCIIFGS
jgi:hypothetical protein